MFSLINDSLKFGGRLKMLFGFLLRWFSDDLLCCQILVIWFFWVLDGWMIDADPTGFGGGFGA